jgi:hypothetical protein
MAEDPDLSRLESDVPLGSRDIPYVRLSRPLSYESSVGRTYLSRRVQIASIVCLVLLMTLTGAWLLVAILVIVMNWR